MKVISNTSPLIALAKIERLPLLQQLFQSITIPRTMYHEFFENCTPTEKSHFLSVYQAFIIVVDVTPCHTFHRRLDQGEQEVLTLALQTSADLVLLDDRKAFNEAQEWHLRVASTRAVLTIAEEQHLIRSYQEIEDMLKQQRFYPPKY